MKSYKSLLCLLLSLLLLLPLFCMPALAEEADETQDTALTLSCPSAVLMEASTGCILYEKDAVARLPMASVTKVMTLLLVMEAIDRGQFHWEDTITASAAAAAKGGSQVYLEEGEQMPLWEMVKCVVVSSANDCATALAEAVAGSESGFVEKMNQRAGELGERVGFEWGGRWQSFPDRPHLQWSAGGRYTSAMVRAGRYPPTMPLYRQEDTDMTKDEIQAMIDAAVTAARPQVYTSVEECPEWARETVQRAVDCGVLQGNQSGALHLTDDNLVNLQMLRNAGLLE